MYIVLTNTCQVLQSILVIEKDMGCYRMCFKESLDHFTCNQFLIPMELFWCQILLADRMFALTFNPILTKFNKIKVEKARTIFQNHFFSPYSSLSAKKVISDVEIKGNFSHTY